MSTTTTTTPASRPLDRRRMLLWILAAAVLVALGAWIGGKYHGMIDLRVYRLGGDALLHGPALYDAKLPGIGLPFTYPPFAAIAMVPLAIVPWGVALVVWTTASVLCLTLIWRASLPKTFWSFVTLRKRTVVLVALTILSLVLEPVWATIDFGQINLMLVAMIVLDLIRPNDARLRGFWLGVTIGIKLTPVPILALLVVTKQWKALRNALLGLLTTIAIGFAFAPKQSWRYWTEVVFDANRVGGIAYSGNQSLNGFLHRLGNTASWVQPTWFVASVIVGLAVLWLARKYWLADERVTAIAVMALAVLFASPISWSHHWVWIIPLGISLIRGVNRVWGLNPAVVAGVLWYGLFVLRSIWWVPYRDDRELSWTFWQSIPGNSHLILGLIAFIVLAITSRGLTRSTSTES
ncbi:glycosyltransferase 87 family protein [Kribbella sp. NBC_01505]|uniref:glycosyltransferase 87 family protein n=1 Tax=Kribbella sp. NBC_01505 TaxID=2903580 RepID=UPI00386EB6A6